MEFGGHDTKKEGQVCGVKTIANSFQELRIAYFSELFVSLAISIVKSQSFFFCCNRENKPVEERIIAQQGNTVAELVNEFGQQISRIKTTLSENHKCAAKLKTI